MSKNGAQNTNTLQSDGDTQCMACEKKAKCLRAGE